MLIKLDAKRLIGILHHTIIKRYGNPPTLIADRDALFTSSSFQEECSKHGISHRMATTGHPQTDARSERTIRTVKDALRTLWDKKNTLEDAIKRVKHAGEKGSPPEDKAIHYSR